MAKIIFLGGLIFLQTTDKYIVNWLPEAIDVTGNLWMQHKNLGSLNNNNIVFLIFFKGE